MFLKCIHSNAEVHSIYWIDALKFIESTSEKSVHNSNFPKSQLQRSQYTRRNHNSNFPWPGIEPGPRRWERRILTTRPPGSGERQAAVFKFSSCSLLHGLLLFVFFSQILILPCWMLTEWIVGYWPIEFNSSMETHLGIFFPVREAKEARDPSFAGH